MSRLFGTWAPPPSLKEQGPQKEIESNLGPQESGGTEHLLPKERAKASFKTLNLTLALDGGGKQTLHRRWLWDAGELYDNSHNYFMSREELVSNHVERFIGIHKKYAEEGYIPKPDDIMMMTNASRNQGAFGLHFGAFASTIASQGTPEQQMEWLIPAVQFKITGCLGQTELGHGSNVRGLQTTAEYDKATKEFVINTPSLMAMKWWPGGMGKTATHCLVYANLIIDGKEYGFHVFMVQLRDENHRPLKGVEPGEVGPKYGDNGTETGFLRLFNVRIPRNWMMMKNQQVLEDGTYVKPDPKMGKSQYGTMLSIRAGLVMGAGYRLAQGVTIAVRYSCVRHQGFTNTQAESKRSDPENPIMDYQNQQYRIFKQLALAYAFVFTGKSISTRFQKIMAELAAGETSELPEMHATSAGLKALCTFEGAAGLEDCRKCCGGHGVLLASGVAQMAQDYATYNTAEGDKIILELQSARYLMKLISEVKKGETIVGMADYLNDAKNGNSTLDASAYLRCKGETPSDFMELALLSTLFRNRAFVWCMETSGRFEELIAQGKSHDFAWNSCAVDLVQCSRVHCYNVILQNFISEINIIEDASVKRVLTNLCQLYALINISEDLGSFEFSHIQKRNIRAAINNLLSVIRPDCVALVDAFEFPDNVLNSALGRHDGKVYESLYAAAKLSPLNRVDPFPGYEEHLRPHLDLEFLAEHAAMQGSGRTSKL